MTVLKMYNDVRENFPDITAKADIEHIRHWDEIDPEYAYSWFESLAKAMNRDMERSVAPEFYSEILEYLRQRFLSGDEEEKNCLDVAFVENLFWRVTDNKAEAYWHVLPRVFQKLYENFHRRTPIKGT